jgi:hypothetical protein
LVNAAVKPLRPSQKEHFPSALLLDRSDKLWISNLTIPYFLYQVHISQRFLIMPSLASILYLMLLKFYARDYTNVFKFANSCVSDTEMAKEEKQVMIFQSLVHIEAFCVKLLPQ